MSESAGHNFGSEDTLGTSISLSVNENSIRIKEKPKPQKDTENDDKFIEDDESKWWLKRPETRLTKMESPNPSPEVTSSMREFLEKEKMCKSQQRSEGEVRDKDDTLCDVLASAAFDKYQSDFENATDEDIGSILEEISKIAGALSPNSVPDKNKSGHSSKNPTEEEKSVEELLEAAEELVRKNSSSLSKSTSKSDTLVPNDKDMDESLGRVRQLEAEIFQLIEKEVHKESEKIRRSPKTERQRDPSPSLEILYENVNVLKAPKTLELQRRKFEEQKVEVSSSSDLDDPIERHSKSEELKSKKKIDKEKDNLQKEIIDVDKDFFDTLLKRSKENLEAGGISGSSSLGQEDFSHFLKILQDQSDKKDQESMQYLVPSNEGEKRCEERTPEFPEKEITEILEKELPNSKVPEAGPSQDEPESRYDDPKKSPDEKSPNVVNSNNELYTVGLTPRLELFADAIPKLLAEKETEKPVVQETPVNFQLMTKSKSTEQISKPVTNFRQSLENIKSSRSEVSRKTGKRSPPTKPRVQTKGVPGKSPKLKSSLIPGVSGKGISTSRNHLAGGDTKKNLSKADFEYLYQEEKHRNSLLKQQLESEIKSYKAQMENMRSSFEEELFALKKRNLVLKTKVDELSLKGFDRGKSNFSLERELERQENMLKSYEAENKRLLEEVKRLQEDSKQVQSRQKPEMSSGILELKDTIKDLQEQTLKLNLEVSELRERNADSLMKNDDLHQQNTLLKDELDMFKEQLNSKNNFITEKLQTMSKNEMEWRKEIEGLRIELNSKTEQLKSVNLEFDRLQMGILPLEKELLELRVKEGQLQEKLQVSRSHVEREKQLSQKLKDQVILDNNKIVDLNRQVREMERILKRKNPDSVSALILTANSDHERIGNEKIKLLEERIFSLESELKSKESVSQSKLAEFQRKFVEMKEKYETQILELEDKLSETTSKLRGAEKIRCDTFTQTVARNLENKSVETNKREDAAAAAAGPKPSKPGPKSQNLKEDTHLIATIRGLKLELANKEKTISKLTKEFQELQKTNRRLQKEREKLLNEKRVNKGMDFDRNCRLTASDSKLQNSVIKQSDNDPNSNVYHQNGHVLQGQKLTVSTQKLYDPMQYSESNENAVIKKLNNENEILKEELNKMNKDFMALKNKRLHDLNLLQEEHERELATLVKEYSVKFGDSKVVKLQGQINTQVAVISHLKQQIEKLRDYKEQVVVLKAEREHLENKVKTLNEKVKYLSTPSTEQLQLLQDKITILQQRHESREMTLQSLVRDLLRNKSQCKDCKGEKGKNKQLCFFRQELDHILGMLQEISNVQ